jgi:aspartate/methionine/tyrosine aminotransferase
MLRMDHRRSERPRAGVVAFPRLLGPGTAADFSAAVLAQTGILVAPSPHFDGGAHHLRVGFGVRNTPAILALLERYLDQRGHDGASW